MDVIISNSSNVPIYKQIVDQIKEQIIKGELKKGVGQLKDRLTKTELQRKLKEATSNEHCHANVSLLNEISEKTND